jgi:uncharacterized membrane protein
VSLRPRLRFLLSLPGLFAVLALTFGLALLFLTPPFQSPDEPEHFLRAYQVSEGTLMAPYREGRGGGDLPAAVVLSTTKFRRLDYRGDLKTSRAEILGVVREPFDLSAREWAFFPNTAVYSPVSYAPQAAGILLARWAGLSPTAMLYAGRLVNLLVFIALGVLALRLTPVLAHAIFLLLIMPMTVSLAASQSADTVTNGLAVLWTALVLREASRTGPFSRRSWAILSAVIAALALAKLAYVPLVVLVILIPAARFESVARRVATLTALVVLAAAVSALWSATTPGLDARLIDRAGVEPRAQWSGIVADPWSFARVLQATIERNWDFYVKSFVGRLGWIDVHLHPRVVWAYLLALAVCCWPRVSEPVFRPRAVTIGLACAVVAVVVVLIAILDYVFWSAVNLGRVDGLQGRYLIPIMPALFLAVRSALDGMPSRLWTNQSARWDVGVAAMAVATAVYTVDTVYWRYYISIG